MQKSYVATFPISLASFDHVLSSDKDFPHGYPGHWDRDPFLAPAPVRSLSRTFNFFDEGGANFQGWLEVEEDSAQSIRVTFTIRVSDYDPDDLADEDSHGYTEDMANLSEFFADESLSWETSFGEEEGQADSMEWGLPDTSVPIQFTLSRLSREVLTAFGDSLPME